jgi:hypothetical protein
MCVFNTVFTQFHFGSLQRGTFKVAFHDQAIHSLS